MARTHFWPLGTKGMSFFVPLFIAPIGKLSVLTLSVPPQPLQLRTHTYLLLHLLNLLHRAPPDVLLFNADIG